MNLARHYYCRICTIVIVLITIILVAYNSYKTNNEKADVKISVAELLQKRKIKKFLSKDVNLDKVDYVKASVNMKQFFELQQQGFDPQLEVEIDKDELIDQQYHTFAEVNEIIEYYKKSFPEIVHVEKIGEGSVKKLPIWAIKISDNPRDHESEPSVLFTGIHHAKELLGAEVCLYLLKYFCQNYYSDRKVKFWVDNTEIWIVPVINPDGYYLVMDTNNAPNFWRKNLTDNNLNGRFDSEKDGVDLNRNYDYNWIAEGDSDPRSWYYRGPYPFSEKEIQAIKNLTFREKFVFHLDYHSYGEIILYPWDNFKAPPDIDLIIDIAKEMAKRVTKKAQLVHYSIGPLNGRLGQSSVWMRGKASVLSYTVEVGDSHFPKGRYLPEIISQNANAAFYILDRLSFSLVEGIVRNAYSKVPVSAELEVFELNSPVVVNPVSDPMTGYYCKVLLPGLYTLKFSSPGFRTKMIHSVKINADKKNFLNVDLYPIDDMLQTEN